MPVAGLSARRFQCIGRGRRRCRPEGGRSGARHHARQRHAATDARAQGRDDRSAGSHPRSRHRIVQWRRHDADRLLRNRPLAGTAAGARPQPARGHSAGSHPVHFHPLACRARDLRRLAEPDRRQGAGQCARQRGGGGQGHQPAALVHVCAEADAGGRGRSHREDAVGVGGHRLFGELHQRQPRRGVQPHQGWPGERVRQSGLQSHRPDRPDRGGHPVQRRVRQGHRLHHRLRRARHRHARQHQHERQDRHQRGYPRSGLELARAEISRLGGDVAQRRGRRPGAAVPEPDAHAQSADRGDGRELLELLRHAEVPVADPFRGRGDGAREDHPLRAQRAGQL